jgi:hypothetical protein
MGSRHLEHGGSPLSLRTWSVAATVSALAAGVIAVAPSSAGLSCNVPSGAYGSIQDAIDDSGCALIVVDSGTFVENLTVSRDLTIRGAGVGETILDAAGNGRGLLVNTGAAVVVNGMTVTGADTTLDGGGIANEGTLTIQSSSISGNKAETFSGAIDNRGVLKINGSTIANNRVTDPLGSGGAIFNYGGGSITVTNSTFSGNSSDYRSGVIHNQDNGSVTLRSVTVSGTYSGSTGGAILNVAGSTVEIRNSTFAANRAGAGPTSIINYGAANEVEIRSSIIVDADANSDACLNAITSHGRSVFGDDTCSSVSSDLAGTDPMIGPLANNGGPVKTHALLAGSPAINLGFTEGPSCKATDARGVPRPVGLRCDSGVYEYVECHGTLVNRVGTGGRDDITGTGSRDGFLAFGGNDDLFGRDGNDRFCAGGGNDDVFGQSGADALYGEGGDDLLDGGPDSDLCRGGPGVDDLVSCET